MTQVLGFVGLGKMGDPLTRRLLKANHSVVIYDTRQDALSDLLHAGATQAASLQQLAQRASTVFVSLPMPDTVKSVILGEHGLISGGGAMKTIVDLSTTGPKVASEIARELEGTGVTFIDCPVSGGVAKAIDGTLALMVSGPRKTFEEVEPLLVHFGRPTFIGEEHGAAQMMKLCNNLMAATSMAISAEAITAGVKAGIDPSIMVDVINASSGRNNATQDKFPRAVLNRTFDHGFATGLMFKDVKLCLEEIERMGLELEVSKAVAATWKKSNERFGPDSDHTVIVKMIEEPAGVVIERRK
mgnify:FL=1